ALDEHNQITAFDAPHELPAALVLAYTAATVSEPGELVIELTPVGRGSGAPHQMITLRDAPIAHGAAEVWSIETPDADGQLPGWSARRDLDASKRDDRHFTLNAASGEVHFGDGDRGRMPPRGVALLARFSRSAGAEGNIRAALAWTLADDVRNSALLGEDVADVAARLAPAENPAAASGGTDQETVNYGAGRAAESLWAHERLVELGGSTLDQLDRARVMGRRAPERAVTLLDYERLALDVPGTRIARARAWSGIDPAYPCLSAPGTVTVVVVPFLPRTRPYPTAGLLQTVRDYLDHYRVIGTRLVVAAPQYVTVRVRATVRRRAGTDAQRVLAGVQVALDSFLDPLHGGPDGRGWPFGRDVYRAEILQTIDNVTGVDHVLALELLAGDDDGDCGNLCVGPLALVTPGPHQIEIK
ncbi:MAG: baseplate J/gp47 family protein, partial [Phototrophicaceae bacterium]